jgi:pimeloyl-ACP methyl ester carboxylesterase
VDSSPENLADAVERAMDAAGLETAHVAGNSLGGWISLELAQRGRTATFIAISPAGLASRREARWAAGILRAERRIARTSPPAEAVVRNPVGRTLVAGPAFARPWRIEPDDLIEQTRLLADAPGFEPTHSRRRWAQVRGLGAQSAARCSSCGERWM